MLRLRVAAQGVTVIAALGALPLSLASSRSPGSRADLLLHALAGGSLYYQSERRAERNRVEAAKAEAATAAAPSEVSAQP